MGLWQTISQSWGTQKAEQITQPQASAPTSTPTPAQSPPPRKAPAPQQKGDTLNSLGGVKQIIGVASGKGGVGKSTTAVNLAYTLASQGLRVGLLDADIYGPSVPLLTGVKNPEHMAGNLVIPPEQNGIKMISAAMFASANQAQILRGPMAGNMVKQFLTQVQWGALDYLIIDYPPGTGDIQLTIAQGSSVSGIVLVTTPQELALIDVRKAISMFQTVKTPIIGIIETMSYFTCDGCDKKHYLFQKDGGKKLAEEFGLPLLGAIPMFSDFSEVTSVYLDIATRMGQELSTMTRASEAGLESFELTWQN